MSKRFILLLVSVALVASTATVVTMSSHRKSAASSTDVAKKPGTSSAEPLYAYGTGGYFVLMRGSQEVARVQRSFDNEDPDNNQVAWTFDGRYVAFLSRSADPLTDHTPGQLIVVNTATSAVSRLSCPSCDTLTAVSGDTVLTLNRSDQGYQMYSFDLASSKPGTPVDMSGLEYPEAYNGFMAGAAGQVLVGFQGAKDYSTNGIYLMKADGSSGAYSKEIPDQGRAISAVAAEQTAYNRAEIAVVLHDYDGERRGKCVGTESLKLISMSGTEVDTDMSTARPSTDGDTHRNGWRFDDLWWGPDGHLHAIITASTCNASGDSLSVTPDSLYRLDGNLWVQEDASSVTLERIFSATAKAVVTEQDCTIDRSIPKYYCGTGPLYFEESGKRSLVADHVILISTPPFAFKGTTSPI